MIKILQKKLLKTPIENTSTILREVDVFSSELAIQLLSNPYLGEGIYGLELVSEGNDVERYVITPSLYREEIGAEIHRDYGCLLNDVTYLHCYKIILIRPSFYPLFIQEPFPLLENLRILCSKYPFMYAQFLFTKRMDTWQNDFLEQYEAYLNGNDFPSKYAVGRKAQGILLHLMDRISGFSPKRETAEEIEQKILDHCYRFEFRLMIQSEERVQELEEEIREILKEMDFFNELCLIKVNNKKRFLTHFLKRKYLPDSKEQSLSESELLAVMSGYLKEEEKRKTTPSIQERKIDTEDSESIVSLLPMGEKTKRELDGELAERIPPALKTAKVLRNQTMVLKEAELGPTVQIVTFEIPEGILYTDVTKKQKDIETILGKQQISIIPGKDPNTISFLIPCAKREVIYLSELLRSADFIRFSQEHPLPIACGIDIFNRPVFRCLTDAPHLLIAGATNSGKSVFMNALLIGLILCKNPDELRLFLIDPKQVELPQYNGFAHVEKVITDMNEAYDLLERLTVEMDKRYALFAKTGVKKIRDYNKKVKEKMSYIVVAVDEYADLQMEHPEVEDLIKRITQLARAAGIHLILATQRPSSDVLTGVIKSNIPSQVSFALNKSIDYQTVFGSGIPFKLLGFGDGVIRYMGQTEEFIRFQSPVISLDSEEEEHTIEKVKQYYQGDNVDKLELSPLLKEPLETPIEKLKRIVLETGETRSKPLQEQMGIRMSDVLDLRNQLVEEGILMKEGKNYFLVKEE